MTYESQKSKDSFPGNGVATSFPTPFTFVANSHVKCVLAVANANGGYDETPLEEGVDYSLSGAGNESGGTITYPLAGSAQGILASTQRLVCWLKPPIVQSTNLENAGTLDLEVHERALDLLTMICQSLQEQLGRAVLYPVSTPDSDILDSTGLLEATTANKTAAQAAQVAAEAASADAAAAKLAADADTLLAEGHAETASAGAAVVSANLTAINNITANLSFIQDAPANATAAAAAASTATTKANEANASALAAAQSASEAAAAASGGAVKVSSDDTSFGFLEGKLLAGEGLAASTQNGGGAETRTLAVALAASSGLEFDAGLLRVKAGTGLALSASGITADVGTTAGKLVQLDASGRLPAVSGSLLTGLTASQISGLSSGMPTGVVVAVASSTIPSGFLECNGAAISRTTYAALFAAIGVAHGYGNNSTTFNLPDYRGRFLRGWDHGIARDPDRASRTAMNTGGATGDNVGSVQADEFKSHVHAFSGPTGGGYGPQVPWTSNGLYNVNTQGAGGNETRPINANVMYCIKY